MAATDVNAGAWKTFNRREPATVALDVGPTHRVGRSDQATWEDCLAELVALTVVLAVATIAQLVNT